MGEPLEGGPHPVCSSLAAVLHDSPGVGWADPGPGLEKICHA